MKRFFQRRNRFQFVIILLLLLSLISVLTVIRQRQIFHPHASTNQYIYFGAYVAGGQSNLPTLQTFETDAGKGVGVFMWYQQWGATDGSQNFNSSWMDTIRNHGAIPMVTWEPWAYNVTDPNYTLASIINGSHDSYITAWAQASKNWGHPYFLRFAHEMNGNWYPWGQGVNGNTSGQYAQAWQHVHNIFTSVGATNVTWVWSPNEGTVTSDLYPGDSYVDWTGIDGYNYGNSRTFGWQTFSQIFNNTNIPQLAPNKPMFINEVASVEQTPPAGQSKATWITDMLTTQLPTNFPNVKGIIWFNHQDTSTQPWPIESSSTAQAAFAQGISNPIYINNQFANLNQSPIQPYSPPGLTPTPTPVVSVNGTLEAETMSWSPSTNGGVYADSSASNGQILVLFGNATATGTVSGAASTLTVTALGDQCSGAPDMIIAIDGTQIATTTVPATAWTNYSFPVSFTSGNHTLTVTFDNDYSSPTCDRNLKLDRFALSSSSIVPTATILPTATPTSVSTDTIAPIVSFTSPSGTTVTRNSQQTMSVNASDNVGVTQVLFYVNNTLRCTVTQTPYVCNWSTTNNPNASYTLQAVAYDAANNRSTATKTVKATK